jgi:hypothetical protein
MPAAKVTASLNTRELEEFNAFCEEALNAFNSDKDEAVADLVLDNPYLMGLSNGGRVLNSEPVQWIAENWTEESRKDLDYARSELATSARNLLNAINRPESFGHSIPPLRWMKNFLAATRKFTIALNPFLRQVSTERFEHRGLRVNNPELLPEDTVKSMLSSIDYVVDLFKSRGVEEVLKDSLTQVTLRKQTDKGSNVVGLYRLAQKEVILTPVPPSKGRQLDRFINEVFLHEVGHHVHMSVMDKSAAQEWDSGWDEVKDAKQKKEAVRKVTYEQRAAFWDMLVAAKGDLKKVKLKGIDRMKFHAWLSHPTVGDSLVTGKNLKWKSAEAASFFRDPDALAAERAARSGDTSPEKIAKELAWLNKKFRSNLGASGQDRGYAWPILSEYDVEAYASEDTGVQLALEKLGLPTDYAHENEREDFAETFVTYMTRPQDLSKTALFRMRRALHLSGMVGSPIMKTIASKEPMERSKLSAGISDLAILKKVATKTKVTSISGAEVITALQTLNKGWSVETTQEALPVRGRTVFLFDKAPLLAMGASFVYLDAARFTAAWWHSQRKGEWTQPPPDKATIDKATKYLIDEILRHVTVDKSPKNMTAGQVFISAKPKVERTDNEPFFGQEQDTPHVLTLAATITGVRQAVEAFKFTSPDGSTVTLDDPAAAGFWTWLYGKTTAVADAKAYIDNPDVANQALAEDRRKVEQRKLASLSGTAGHCPVCDSLQRLRNGDMVLHGYERPGWGEVVGRCSGVGYPAYELSPAGCIAYKAEVADLLKKAHTSLAEAKARTSATLYLPTEAQTYVASVVDLGTGEVVSQGGQPLTLGQLSSIGRTYVRKGASLKDAAQAQKEREVSTATSRIKFYEQEDVRMDSRIKNWEEKPLPKG